MDYLGKDPVVTLVYNLYARPVVFNSMRMWQNSQKKFVFNATVNVSEPRGAAGCSLRRFFQQLPGCTVGILDNLNHL